MTLQNRIGVYGRLVLLLIHKDSSKRPTEVGFKPTPPNPRLDVLSIKLLCHNTGLGLQFLMLAAHCPPLQLLRNNLYLNDNRRIDIVKAYGVWITWISRGLIMSEINKEGFLGGELKAVQRSNLYWEHMKIIKTTMNAANFNHFWIDRAKELQGLMRTKAPKVVNDWYRYEYAGFTVTFTISDEAIKLLQPSVREFSSFGSAVKIFGSYESFLLEIIKRTIEKFPEKVVCFSETHKMGNFKKLKEKDFMWRKLGRGLSFIEEIFDCHFHPSYSPCINFFYELRNIAVHNCSIADEELCKFSESEFITLDRKIKCGDHVEWSLQSLLQLHQYIIQIMDEIDAVVHHPLMLDSRLNTAHWYYTKHNL